MDLHESDNESIISETSLEDEENPDLSNKLENLNISNSKKIQVGNNIYLTLDKESSIDILKQLGAKIVTLNVTDPESKPSDENRTETEKPYHQNSLENVILLNESAQFIESDQKISSYCNLESEKKCSLTPTKSGRVKTSKDIKIENVQWKRLPNCFMEKYGFHLGVQGYVHYENEGEVVAEVQNGDNFQITLCNKNEGRCNVDITVNGIVVAQIQLQAKEEFLLDGPIDGENKLSKRFIFLRSRDAPEEAEIQILDPENGVIEAIFMPELLSRSFQLPANPLVSNWCGGAVALQENTSSSIFESAENIIASYENTVVLKLRMIARLDDHNKPDPSFKITPLFESKKPRSFPV